MRASDGSPVVADGRRRDEVFAAIRECHERIHGMGAPRIHTDIKLGTRTDREQSLEDKVESVEAKRRG